MNKKALLLVTIGAQASPPTDLYTKSRAPGLVRGAASGVRFSAAGGTPPYTFAVTDGVEPDGTALDTVTGDLVGTPTTQDYYEFEVTTTDSLGATDFAVFALAVKGGISVATGLPDSEDSIAYNASLKATGGAPPYTWSLVDGALPGGMSLVGDAIDGTPSNASNFQTVAFFRLRATDTNGNYGEADFSIAIWPPPFVSSSLSTLDIGGPEVAFVNGLYTAQAVGRHGVSGNGLANGPAITYALGAGAAPGISINATTGAISGFPTTAGDYTLEVLTTDALGGTGTTGASYSMRVFANGQMKKYADYFGDGSTTDILVTHNFGSAPYTVTVYDTFTGLDLVDVPMQGIDGNSFTLSFKDPPGIGQMLVQVLG